MQYSEIVHIESFFVKDDFACTLKLTINLYDQQKKNKADDSLMGFVIYGQSIFYKLRYTSN